MEREADQMHCAQQFILDKRDREKSGRRKGEREERESGHRSHTKR